MHSLSALSEAPAWNRELRWWIALCPSESLSPRSLSAQEGRHGQEGPRASTAGAGPDARGPVVVIVQVQTEDEPLYRTGGLCPLASLSAIHDRYIAMAASIAGGVSPVCGFGFLSKCASTLHWLPVCFTVDAYTTHQA